MTVGEVTFEGVATVPGMGGYKEEVKLLEL